MVMSRRLDRRKPVKAVRRELRRRLKSAVRELRGDGRLETRVHKARRNLKKARAFLRLLAKALPHRRRRKLNALCRDAALALRAARDGAALECAWEGLRLGPAGRALLRARRETAERAFKESGLDEALRGLRRAIRRAKTLPLSDPRGKTLDQGLGRACARLRRAFREAERERSDTAFHQWRKRAKDVRYQLDLLALPKVASVSRVLKRLKALTDLLGDDHDLAALSALIAAMPKEFGGPAGVLAAQAAIARRRRVFRRGALALGRRWGADDPKQAGRARQGVLEGRMRR